MDLTAQIAAAMSAWLEGFASGLLGPALGAVAELLFRTPAFDTLPPVRETWELVRGVADALFVLAWLGAGILVMTSGGVDARYTAKSLVPRVALAAIFANASLALCGALVGFNNAIVSALLGRGSENVFSQFAASLETADPVNAVVGMLIAVIAAVLALLLVVLCIGRALLLLLLVVLGPIALATYALPQTSEVAHLWWRVFCGLLFVQVVQAMLVALAVGVFAHTDWLAGAANDLVSALVAVAVLYLLFRLPFATYEWALRRPVNGSHIVRSVVVGARALAVL